MFKQKYFNYIYILLFSILIIMLSLTFKGIINLYSSAFYRSSNINLTVKKYIMGGNYSFDLPSGWNYAQQNFQGGEVIYHADFSSPDKKVRGFTEVWKINITLADFLEKSKESATGEVDFKFYNLKNVKIGIYNGFVLEYSRKGNDGKYYRAFEYFIPAKGNYFFRLSFFVSEDDFNNNIEMMIKSIANTIRVKNYL